MVAYDTAVAVDQVSLRVGPGEIVALVGPSGSGKSSLLRAVAGLEPLADGWIAWDGADIGRLPVNRRGFVLMFQDGQLFPHLSVAGNVAYGLTGLPRRERRRRVDGLLKLVGLAGFGRRRVTALSGGQAQRVALARSLGPRPKLLLLDEPLAALDPGLRQHLVTVLGDSLRATATPALYVTHDLDEAFALADKVAVLIDGRLLQVGAPDELWRQPADRQVAQFLGYGPFLDIAQAAGLGLTIPPGRRLGLGPRGLQPDRHGLALPVLATRPGRGVVEAVVRLPAGATARLSLPQPPGATVLVRLDPDGCCLVPAD
jgi:thiamine transport system ATP-binding protein